MNNTQIQLVKLLNKSLVKEKIDIDKNINLSELISEAKINKVEALIYSAITTQRSTVPAGKVFEA